MNVISFRDPDFEHRLAHMAASSSLFDQAIEERTRAIVHAVAKRGDAAVLEFTERFDGPTLQPDQVAVTRSEFMAASLKADQGLRHAVQTAGRNIAAFARKSLHKSWTTRNAQRGQVGEKFDPFKRVGIYVPGGKAPLVSTALMTILLAREAGCPEIVVCTPCGKDGAVNPALLFSAHTAGATEIYRLGGAQAIAAMALGTETIRPVQKIFGPGNAYVVAAKRLLFGRVAIDLLPGPSELLVLADETAPPAFVAADLLAQAEHGSGHERIWLATPSSQLLRATQREIAKQSDTLQRRDYIRSVLDKNAWLIQVRSLAEAVELANLLAPEHCEVITREPSKVARGITTAGALFLGPWTPTVLGDYMAGPSHVLPTGGAGISFAGLTVDQFQRRTSVVQYMPPALKRSMRTLEQFAAMEGLEAHGRSARIRLEISPSSRPSIRRPRPRS